MLVSVSLSHTHHLCLCLSLTHTFVSVSLSLTHPSCLCLSFTHTPAVRPHPPSPTTPPPDRGGGGDRGVAGRSVVVADRCAKGHSSLHTLRLLARGEGEGGCGGGGTQSAGMSGPPIHPLNVLATYLPTYLPTYIPTYLPTYPPTHIPIYPPTGRPAYLPTYLPTYLKTRGTVTSTYAQGQHVLRGVRRAGAGCSAITTSTRRSFLHQAESHTFKLLHRVSSSLLGPVDPSFRALSRRLKFPIRRYKFNKILSSCRCKGRCGSTSTSASAPFTS